jgi:hypothetical protein
MTDRTDWTVGHVAAKLGPLPKNLESWEQVEAEPTEDPEAGPTKM